MKLAEFYPIDQGLFPDQPEENNNFWESGQNAIFEQGFVRPAFGSVIVDEVEGLVPTGMGQNYDSTARGFIGTTSKIWQFTDPTTPAITPTNYVGSGYTGGEGDLWGFTPWDNWMIATNGVDAPQVYKGVSFSALSGTPPTYGKIMVPRYPYLLMANTDQGPNVFEWCDFDDPEDWVPTATNDADSSSLKESESEITCGGTLRDEIVLYTRDAQWLIPYAGKPFIFDQQKLSDEIGAVGRKAVCAVGTKHYGFGPQGLWMSDGNSSDYIDNSIVRKLIYEDFNTTYANKVVVWHSKTEHSVIFSWPQAGQTRNTKSVAFDYLNGKWTVLGWAPSSALEAKVFSVDLAGIYTGVIMRLGSQTTPFYWPTFGYGGGSTYGYGAGGYGGYDVGTQGRVELVSKPFRIEDGEMQAQIQQIISAIKGTATNATIELASGDNINGTFTFGTAQSLTEGPLNFREADGFYHKIRIRDAQATSRWQLSRFRLYGELTHGRRP